MKVLKCRAVSELPPIPVRIRTYESRDRDVVKHLYAEGLIGGHIAPNDTGLDIDDVQGAYLSSPSSATPNPSASTASATSASWN